MEFNYLVNQNCVELMNSMDENSVDLTVTSPPYDQLRNYEGYDFDFKSIADGLFRIISSKNNIPLSAKSLFILNLVFNL